MVCTVSAANLAADLLVLLADQALEDLPDHRKMRLMPSELPVQIDEVTRRRIQPLCEQPRDEKGDLRAASWLLPSHACLVIGTTEEASSSSKQLSFPSNFSRAPSANH